MLVTDERSNSSVPPQKSYFDCRNSGSALAALSFSSFFCSDEKINHASTMAFNHKVK